MPEILIFLAGLAVTTLTVYSVYRIGIAEELDLAREEAEREIRRLQARRTPRARRGERSRMLVSSGE